MKIKVILISLVVLMVIGAVSTIGLKVVVADQIKVAGITPALRNQDINKERSAIYYFHGNIRCTTCRKIEQYTKNVFEQKFKDKLDFAAINVDEPQNRHFINDYQLASKAIILVKNSDGKEVEYKNLQEMWTYVRNEEEFNSWLENSVNDFLLSN